MNEQEEKQEVSNESLQREAPVAENNPGEPLSEDPKRPNEDKSKHQKERNGGDIFKDSLDKRKNRKSPSQIIRECLEKSFDVSTIENFCSHHEKLQAVKRNLRGNEDFDKIVARIMEYCSQNAYEDLLWDYIRQERERQYGVYYPQWHAAIKASRDPVDQYGDASEAHRPKGQLPPDDEIKKHPLSGNDGAAINDWFHNELDAHEKSMVLTIALFSGLNRKHMGSISNEIQRRLFETTQTT